MPSWGHRGIFPKSYAKGLKLAFRGSQNLRLKSLACLPLRDERHGMKKHEILSPHAHYPLLSDLGSKHRAKPVRPKPDRLMADVDPALGQEILDVAQRQRVLHVHHHDQTDHFWRAVEISERVTHGLKLPQPKRSQKIALTVPSRRAKRIRFGHVAKRAANEVNAMAAIPGGARACASTAQCGPIVGYWRPTLQ